MPDKHPHILKICADQFAPHVWGLGGDPYVRTPHLDALAAGGTISEFRAPDGNHRAEGLPGGIWWVMAKRGSIKLVDYGPDRPEAEAHRNNPQQAFDLASDPDERYPLPADHPDLPFLRQQIHAYRTSIC